MALSPPHSQLWPGEERQTADSLHKKSLTANKNGQTISFVLVAPAKKSEIITKDASGCMVGAMCPARRMVLKVKSTSDPGA